MERSNGFTIIELLVVISIMAILAALAIPSYLDFFEKGRLRGATEAVYEQLQYARAQALKKSVPIIVNFTANNNTTWILVMTDDTGTELTRLEGADFSNITMNAPLFNTDTDKDSPTTPKRLDACATTTPVSAACFEPIRGLSRKTATHIELTNGDYKLQVRVEESGRVKICVPSGKFIGYDDC